MPTTTSEKRCVLCGMDVSQVRRTKDTKGNYFCASCYENAATRVHPSAAAASVKPLLEPAIVASTDPPQVIKSKRRMKRSEKVACAVVIAVCVIAFIGWEISQCRGIMNSGKDGGDKAELAARSAAIATHSAGDQQKREEEQAEELKKDEALTKPQEEASARSARLKEIYDDPVLHPILANDEDFLSWKSRLTGGNWHKENWETLNNHIQFYLASGRLNLNYEDLDHLHKVMDDLKNLADTK